MCSSYWSPPSLILSSQLKFWTSASQKLSNALKSYIFLLESPIVDTEFPIKVLDKCISKAIKCLEKLHLQDDPQFSLGIYRTCLAAPKLTYSLRILPPSQSVGSSLRVFDELLHDALSAIVGSPVPELPCLSRMVGKPGTNTSLLSLVIRFSQLIRSRFSPKATSSIPRNSFVPPMISVNSPEALIHPLLLKNRSKKNSIRLPITLFSCLSQIPASNLSFSRSLWPTGA